MQNDLISRSGLIAHIGDLGIDPEDDTTFLTTGQACAIAHKCIVEMVKEEPAVDAVERKKLIKKMFPMGVPNTREEWNYSINAKAVYEAIMKTEG